MNDKPILVTGGTGMLGSYLLRYLVHQGYTNITAIKRANSSFALVESVRNNIRWVEGDILDVPFLEEVIEGKEQIYHCAAIVSFGGKNQKQMLQTNVEGTANIVNLALDFGVKKLLHVSSIAAIGRTKKDSSISEKTKWTRSDHNSYYAISKYQAEQEVWRGMAEGLNIVIINPSVVIGSGFWNRGTCQLFERVWKGQKLYPEGTTGFVDVRDVARMMIQLMESAISGERFLANGENLSYLSFFSQVAKVLGKSAPSIKATKFLKELAWRMDWLRNKITGQSRVITKTRALTTSRKYLYQNQKSIEALNFQYTPIEQTIRETGTQFLHAKKNNLSATYLAIK